MRARKVGLWLVAVTACLFTSIPSVAQVQDDLQAYPACKYCGMDRKQFAHSRMLIEYEGAPAAATCSIHCVAVDFALNIDKMPKTISVGDYDSKALIDAEKAYWVIGGSQMGVMSKRAKWAFGKKDYAEKFVKANGGQLATFDEAMKAAYEDMYSDTKMIREKRKMKKMEHKHP
jgi:copper chaperone NosL